jgi:hypothetical protein
VTIQGRWWTWWGRPIVDAEAGIHRFHPQDRAERRASPQQAARLVQRGEHEVPQSPCACTSKIKDMWDIQYNPRSTDSTQFMGKNVRAMNSILACLDTCIRSSGNSSTHLRQLPSSPKSNYRSSRTHCRCQCVVLHPRVEGADKRFLPRRSRGCHSGESQ